MLMRTRTGAVFLYVNCSFFSYLHQLDAATEETENVKLLDSFYKDGIYHGRSGNFINDQRNCNIGSPHRSYLHGRTTKTLLFRLPHLPV